MAASASRKVAGKEAIMSGECSFGTKFWQEPVKTNTKGKGKQQEQGVPGSYTRRDRCSLGCCIEDVPFRQFRRRRPDTVRIGHRWGALGRVHHIVPDSSTSRLLVQDVCKRSASPQPYLIERG